jgi:hypothetical protein
METVTNEATKTYTLRMLDGSGVELEIKAASDEAAKEEARDWARDGDWDVQSTIWVSVRVLDADGEDVDDVTVEINPPEPKCSSAEGHDWQSPIEIVGGIEENPGVWGHGGGVKIYVVCMRCGCGRITDTWAQDSDTGRQGLTSVEYDTARYVEAWRRLVVEEG